MKTFDNHINNMATGFEVNMENMRLILPTDADNHQTVITRDQIRAARALLSWSQQDLATAAGVGLATIRDIERGARDARGSTYQAIEEAFARAGVVALEPGDHRGEGRGVRFLRREQS